MSDIVIIDSPGQPVPARIELKESSGPVSPRFQYETHVLVTAGEGRVELRYDERREYREGAPQRVVRFSRELSLKEYEELWRELLRFDALAPDRDLVGAANRTRVGVSFNYFEIHLGQRRTRCEYLLSSLRADEAALCRGVVETLRLLARYAPDGTREESD